MGLFGNDKQRKYYVCPRCGDMLKYDPPIYHPSYEERTTCKYCKVKRVTEYYDTTTFFKDFKEGIYQKYVAGNPEHERAARGSAYRRAESERIDREFEERVRNAPLKCPRCSSTAVVVGTRGYSMITGFIGSGETMNRCGNCGYKWKPRG